MLNLDKNKHYLLACSFGPDSMALFYLLKKEGYNFSVANVNYNFRDEAKQESLDLKEYCSLQKIDFYHFENKKTITHNIEEEAREIRYNFFKELVDKYKFDYLLVAHNQDDLLETYLLQQKRNIIPSMYGIAENTSIFGINVIRPLLKYPKAQLLNICKINKIPYCIDKSNLSDDYERNKIRHNIIEKLSDEEKINLKNEITYHNVELEKTQAKIDLIKDLNISEISKLSSFEFAVLLNRKLQTLDPSLSISLRYSIEIKKKILSKKPNIEMVISKDIVLNKEYEKLIFVKGSDIKRFNYKLNRNDIVDDSLIYFDVSKWSEEHNIPDEYFPIIIRNALPNDIPIRKGHLRRFSRLAIDWKMPIRLRKEWPVFINSQGQLFYIPRYQSNFANYTNYFYLKV